MNVLWGDGFVCRVDLTDPDTVYAESQDGNMALRTEDRGVVPDRPRARPGLQPFRFNWNTPFILSPQRPVFYAAGNYVFRPSAAAPTCRPCRPRSR